MELNPKQFFCQHCGEPLDNHVSEGKHGANFLFPEIQAKVGDGDTPIDLIRAVNNIEKTKRIDLNNRDELIHHLESVQGHGLIDDVGANSVEYRDAYGHIEENIPGIDWNSEKPTFSTEELQSLHNWLHSKSNIPHLTVGNEHYHLEDNN